MTLSKIFLTVLRCSILLSVVIGMVQGIQGINKESKNLDYLIDVLESDEENYCKGWNDKELCTEISTSRQLSLYNFHMVQLLYSIIYILPGLILLMVLIFGGFNKSKEENKNE